MTNQVNERLKRVPTWDKVQRVLESVGWRLTKDTERKKVFVRKNEMIVAFRTVGGKWKSEYFYLNRLEDSTGFLMLTL